jgi:hypothetical protein
MRTLVQDIENDEESEYNESHDDSYDEEEKISTDEDAQLYDHIYDEYLSYSYDRTYYEYLENIYIKTHDTQHVELEGEEICESCRQFLCECDTCKCWRCVNYAEANIIIDD